MCSSSGFARPSPDVAQDFAADASMALPASPERNIVVVVPAAAVAAADALVVVATSIVHHLNRAAAIFVAVVVEVIGRVGVPCFPKLLMMFQLLLQR